MSRWLAAHREALILALILAAGAALRLYGLNWDNGQWLHPDERQIYFVTLGLGWPHSLAQALSPESPLNPRFFAYGSLPIYLLKIVAALLAPLSPLLRDPDNLHLIGRPLAALFDLGTVYLVYRLARLVLPAPERRGELRGGALLAAAFVALTVLSIQLAHFYTADTLLTFFVVLTLVLAAAVARGAGLGYQLALGAALGLALATKLSAFPLLLLIPVALRLQPEPHTEHQVARLVLTMAVAGATFLLAQPYALIDAPTFLADTVRESRIAWGALDVPYTRQYAGTLPYVYAMWQTALWGLGLPLGLAAWAGLGGVLGRWLRHGSWRDTLFITWAGVYFGIVGVFRARHLRYMLPLVPLLCVAAVQLVWRARPSSSALRRRLWALGPWLLLLGSLAYALAFVRIYAAPHPWITASEWIYDNVPAGSTLAVEEWDTALPLPLNVAGRPRRIAEYDVQTLALYEEPDDAAKWAAVVADLAGSDYLVIASRRLYGSIPRLPERYPLASRYYERLFAGDLGFQLAGEFTRGPTWLNPPIPPLPDAAPALLRPDESFVVYDHPRTLIFRNVERLPAAELLRRLQAR